MTKGDASHTLDEASCSSAQGSLQGAADTSMAAVLRTALAHLQMPQTESAKASALFTGLQTNFFLGCIAAFFEENSPIPGCF